MIPPRLTNTSLGELGKDLCEDKIEYTPFSELEWIDKVGYR